MDIPNHLPWNIHCRRLVIRTYHPFMLPLDSIQLEFLYAHFGARDLQLDLVTVFGEFCIVSLKFQEGRSRELLEANNRPSLVLCDAGGADRRVGR